MSCSRYMYFFLIFFSAGMITGCQKNGDPAPHNYTLTTIYENPLPEPVTIQYLNGSVNGKGDTVIISAREKILIDANSSTQVVETVCLKGCTSYNMLPPPNMARITIGDKQKTDINCNLMTSGTPAVNCSKDSANIFNGAQWSVTRKSSGDVLQTYTLTMPVPDNVK